MVAFPSLSLHVACAFNAIFIVVNEQSSCSRLNSFTISLLWRTHGDSEETVCRSRGKLIARLKLLAVCVSHWK